MRIVVLMILFVSPLLVLRASPPQVKSNPGSTCGAASKGLPDFYYEAVVAGISPPDWKTSLVKIAVGAEVKLLLTTDGENFKLWTNTIDAAQGNVGSFLHHLNDSCRLPADPHDAVALIKIRWDSKELTKLQFDQLHRSFADALARYVDAVQAHYPKMMESGLKVIHLDAEGYAIEYNNSYQQLTLMAWNDAPNDNDPMIQWVHGLREMGRGAFHRPIWRHK